MSLTNAKYRLFITWCILQVSKPSIKTPECHHSPHKDNKIERCIFHHDGSLMSLSKDGIIVHWNKHLAIEKVKQPEHTFRPRPKWITDFAILQVCTSFYI